MYEVFFIEIGCLGTYSVAINRKNEKFKILEPGRLCLLRPGPLKGGQEGNLPRVLNK